MNLQQWIQQTTKLSKFEIAGIIYDELKDQSPDLDKAIVPDSFSNSFHTPQVIVSIEVWSREMLPKLHDYLRSRPANIQNFFVISLGHFGIDKWWKINCQDEQTFNSVEVADIPFGEKHCSYYSYKNYVTNFWNRNIWYNDCRQINLETRTPLTHYFCYMSGTNSGSVDQGLVKHYLALQMLQFEPRALISLGWPLYDSQLIADWVDFKTYWSRQDLVNDVNVLYQNAKNRLVDYIPNQDFIAHSAYLHQHSFAQVVRETVMDQPFSCFSEKTYRSFIFGQMVLPTTWNSVNYLENLGFLFDHNFFDYSYQQEQNVVLRFHLLAQSLREFVANYSLQELEKYQQTHMQNFLHNQTLALKLTELYDT